MTWWKQGVIYQIYPRSFKDSDGDGIGDLKGITAKLDYLQELGIDAVWLSPVFRSPQDDNGYDVSNYKEIDPMFGTLEDMDRLIQQAKKHNIRIIMDIVFNHSSDEHPWFIEARKSRSNPYHDYYIWKERPTGLRSVFLGSAWQYVPEVNEYYLHQFSVKQPDLNWANESLRKDLYSIINWWIDRGVGGFRFDVADRFGKDIDAEQMEEGPFEHMYIQEMNQASFGPHDLVTVGETWSATVESAKLYSHPGGNEFSMIFQFEQHQLDQQPGRSKWDLMDLDFVKLKQVLSKWQVGLHNQGWNSLFWDNHDLPRAVSRFGDDTIYRKESAKMLAILLYGMQGTPYIYQGEELGMTNAAYEIEEYRDIETVNMYKERVEKGYSKDSIMASIHKKSRDNARTPMQWDDTDHAGFTTDIPWMKVNPNYTLINAKESLADPDSIFYCYKKLIRLRKKYPVFMNGDYQLLMEKDPDIFAYIRTNTNTKMLVAANFHDQTIAFNGWKDAQILISNYDDQIEGVLRPYEAYIQITNVRNQ